MGKTKEEIQRDKDFSSFEKNPPDRDPRSQKQIDDYRKNQAARAKWARDYKQWEDYRIEFGEAIPKSFATFQKIKYNKDEWDMFKTYLREIRNGRLTPLSSFNLYKKISEEANARLIGLTTANGVQIKSISTHFVTRVIGSVEQRRTGVTINEVVKTLTKPVKIQERTSSTKYIGTRADVTINPLTGNLVQTNPRRRDSNVNTDR